VLVKFSVWLLKFVIAKAMGMFSPLVYEVVFRTMVSWNPFCTLLDADRLENAGLKDKNRHKDANETTKITITKPIKSLLRLFIALTPIMAIAASHLIPRFKAFCFNLQLLRR
jgi:hypothetical protein